MDRWFAAWWLGTGAKYRLSEWLAGADWRLPFSAVVAKHGIRINGATSLRDVVDACKDAAHAAREVAATYGPDVRAVAYDVRDAMWRQIQPWQET